LDRLDGPQSRSGRRGEEKILCPYWDLNSDPSVVQPVANRYTDYAIPFRKLRIRPSAKSLPFTEYYSRLHLRSECRRMRQMHFNDKTRKEDCRECVGLNMWLRRAQISETLMRTRIGGLLDQFCPNCTRYSTGDTVRAGNSFIYNLNHTSLQLHTIISYAVTRLHKYSPYTYVTTVTYSTLARIHSLRALRFNPYCTTAHKVSYYNHLAHSCTGWLLSYQLLCRIIIHTSHLNTSKLSPRSHSAISLLVTDCSRELPRTVSYRELNSCYFSNWAYVAFAPIQRKPVTVALTVAEQRTIDIPPFVVWQDGGSAAYRSQPWKRCSCFASRLARWPLPSNAK
jgi:hypothetical protein